MKTHFFLLYALLLSSVTSLVAQTDIILDERFDNNSKGWYTGNSTTNRYDIYNGNYTIQHKVTTGLALTTISSGISFRDDYELSANIKHLSGQTDYGVGLVFGGSDNKNYYTFGITYTGYYRLGKVTNGTYENVKGWTQHNSIKTGSGSTNKMTVIRRGTTYYLYVNDVNVHTENYVSTFGTRIGFDAYNKQTISVSEMWIYGTKKTNTSVATKVTKVDGEEVIFYDQFDNNYNEWADDMQEGADLYIRNGKYYFHHKRDKSTWMTNQSIDIDETRDYYIEAAIYKVSGEENYGHGLIWGRLDWENYYAFNIANTGYFRVSKEEDDEWTNIKGWTASSAVKKGERVTNVLKIAKVGDRMRFYVNGTFVFDTHYEPVFGNRIGFEIHKRQEIAIDYFKVAYTSDKQVVTRNTPPVITITQPANTRDFNVVKATTKVKYGELVHVEGRAIDNNGISTVIVDGKSATLYQDGSFSANFTANRTKDIKIVATDRLGLSNSKSFKLEVEKQKVVVDNNTKTTTTDDKPTPKRLALVIGNSNYTGGGALKNPVNDARSMKAALEDLGFDVLKYENCDQRMMKRAIDEFGQQLESYDVGFFFYAGHGIQTSGANYLIPVGVELQSEADVEYDCVRADRVMAKMESANAKTNIIVLDACRNNPFERSWARSTNGKGLAFMNAPQGSLIAYATAPGNTAADGLGNNGLYTSALLKHINEPNLGIEAVFKKVRQDVIKESGGKQTPWESTSLTGDFYFKK